jgi:hypothetical protein
VVAALAVPLIYLSFSFIGPSYFAHTFNYCISIKLIVEKGTNKLRKSFGVRSHPRKSLRKREGKKGQVTAFNSYILWERVLLLLPFQ